MDVEVTTPQDHVGDVVGDLNRRRGMIQNQESSGSTVIVQGACAAEGDVRLYLSPAQHDEGPCVLYHAVPSLRSGAAQRGGRDYEEKRLNPATRQLNRRGQQFARAFFMPSAKSPATPAP